MFWTRPREDEIRGIERAISDVEDAGRLGRAEVPIDARMLPNMMVDISEAIRYALQNRIVEQFFTYVDSQMKGCSGISYPYELTVKAISPEKGTQKNLYLLLMTTPDRDKAEARLGFLNADGYLERPEIASFKEIPRHYTPKGHN